MLVKDLLVSLEKLGSDLDNYIVRRIVKCYVGHVIRCFNRLTL